MTALSVITQGTLPVTRYGLDGGGNSRRFFDFKIKNVKDYGAKGNGTSDDTAAIQAAVNAQYAESEDTAFRGRLFFPPGLYRTTSPISLNVGGAFSICITGCGSASRIFGNFPGYILDRPTTSPTKGGRIIENLKIDNTHPVGGCIRINGNVGFTLRDLELSAWNPIECAEGSDSGLIQRCNLLTLPGFPAGSIGIMTSGHKVIQTCDFHGFAEGIRAWGPAITIQGCRLEVNVIGLMLGKLKNGDTWQVQSMNISGNTFEANDTAIYCHALGQSLIAGGNIIGSSNSPNGQANPPQRSKIGLHVAGASYTTFIGLSPSGGFEDSAVKIGPGGAKLTFIGCVANNDGPNNWNDSSTGTVYIQCNETT